MVIYSPLAIIARAGKQAGNQAHLIFLAVVPRSRAQPRSQRGMYRPWPSFEKTLEMNFTRKPYNPNPSPDCLKKSRGEKVYWGDTSSEDYQSFLSKLRQVAKHYYRSRPTHGRRFGYRNSKPDVCLNVPLVVVPSTPTAPADRHSRVQPGPNALHITFIIALSRDFRFPGRAVGQPGQMPPYGVLSYPRLGHRNTRREYGTRSSSSSSRRDVRSSDDSSSSISSGGGGGSLRGAVAAPC